MGRDDQLAPVGDWSTWLVLAGRGFGKTEAGARWIRQQAKNPRAEIALIAETQKDLEEVMVKRILDVHHPDERPKVRYKPVRLTWPNGATALGYNGTEPNQLRGPEFSDAWVDELAKYRYAQETWDMLQFTMRSGPHPRTLVTTTPRPIQIIKDILADPSTALTKGRTMDNAANLPKSFLTNIMRKYAGTRLGRQELEAEILGDVVGALWSLDGLDADRIRRPSKPIQRIVVAIDPPTTSGENSDECGIIVAGVTEGANDNTAIAYVLEDASMEHASPNEWAAQAIRMYEYWGADCIVAETNQGGDMVETILRHLNPLIPYKGIHASKGKTARAEPVAALYEQHRVHHIGTHGTLEDQMVQFKVGGLEDKSKSPDRVDALVYAITELMLEQINTPSLMDVI